MTTGEVGNRALASAWAALRAARRPALVTYLTAGFPSVGASRDALRVADELADVLEVGVPFSDPLADGPTIQRSTFAALEQGMTLAGTLELIAGAALSRPVVVFSYLNPILRYGVARFVADAAALGVAGLLLTDLPAGSDAAIEQEIQDGSLDLIRLLAPTTSEDRIARTVRGARGFLYLVSRLGVTGARATLSTDLEASVARVRAHSSLPVAVGFGIATGEQAARVGQMADGVVVGSALVDRLARDGVPGVRHLLTELRTALHPASPVER
jgi:tryptophan synthase alpha chain